MELRRGLLGEIAHVVRGPGRSQRSRPKTPLCVLSPPPGQPEEPLALDGRTPPGRPGSSPWGLAELGCRQAAPRNQRGPSSPHGLVLLGTGPCARCCGHGLGLACYRAAPGAGACVSMNGGVHGHFRRPLRCAVVQPGHCPHPFSSWATTPSLQEGRAPRLTPSFAHTACVRWALPVHPGLCPEGSSVPHTLL